MPCRTLTKSTVIGNVVMSLDYHSGSHQNALRRFTAYESSKYHEHNILIASVDLIYSVVIVCLLCIARLGKK